MNLVTNQETVFWQLDPCGRIKHFFPANIYPSAIPRSPNNSLKRFGSIMFSYLFEIRFLTVILFIIFCCFQVSENKSWTARGEGENLENGRRNNREGQKI